MEDQLTRMRDADYNIGQLCQHARKLARYDVFDATQTTIARLRQAELDVQAALRAVRLYRPATWDLPPELWSLILEFVFDRRVASVFGKHGAVYIPETSPVPTIMSVNHGSRGRLRSVCRTWAAIIAPLVQCVYIPRHIVRRRSDAAKHAAVFENARCVVLPDVGFVCAGVKRAESKRHVVLLLEEIFSQRPGAILHNHGYPGRRGDPEFNVNGAVVARGPWVKNFSGAAKQRIWAEQDGRTWSYVIHADGFSNLAGERSNTDVVILDLSVRRPPLLDLSNVAWKEIWCSYPGFAVLADNETRVELKSDVTIHVHGRFDVESSGWILAMQWGGPKLLVVLHLDAADDLRVLKTIAITTDVRLRVECRSANFFCTYTD